MPTPKLQMPTGTAPPFSEMARRLNGAIRTERLLLRPLTPSLADAQFMLQLLNDPAWLRFIGDRHVRTVEDAMRYIAAGPLAMYERLGYGHCLVESRATQTAVGLCGLVKRDYLEAPDLGFAFLPEHRGQGYAWEAASASLNHALHGLGMTRILATTRTDNLVSQALLKKLGFQFERLIRHPDGDRDLQLYSVCSSGF